MDSPLSVQPRRGPKSGEEQPETDGDDAKDDLQNALVRIQALTEVSKQRPEAHEDDGESRDKGDRADKGAPAPRAALKTSGGSGKKSEISRYQGKDAGRREGDETRGDGQGNSRKERRGQRGRDHTRPIRRATSSFQASWRRTLSSRDGTLATTTLRPSPAKPFSIASRSSSTVSTDVAWWPKA